MKHYPKLSTTTALLALGLLATACSPAPAAPPAATSAAQTSATVAAVAPTAAAAAAPAATAVAQAAPTLAAAVAAAAPTVAAALGAPEPPVTLTFWHGMQGAQEATIKALVEDYKKVKPNVTINLDFTSYSQNALQQKVMGAIAANSTPDLVQGFPNDTSAWFDAGAVVPLDDYLKGSNGLTQADLEDIYPSLLKEGVFPQYQNKQLGFPFNKSLDGVMVYNAPMLKAAGFDRFPATWAEVETMCQKIVKPDVQCYVIQPSQSRSYIQVFAHGGEVMGGDTKTLSPQFGPGMEKWYDREKSLIEKKLAIVVRDFSWQNEFAAGKVAFSATTSAGDTFIEGLVKGAFEYGFAPMPGESAAGGMSISGTNLVVFKSTAAKQQAAWDFIKWVTQKDQSVRWATATGYLPVRKSAAADPAYRDFLAKKPRFNAVLEGLATAKSEPSIAAWSEVRTAMGDVENKVTSLTASPKAGAEELVTKATAALKR
ncbi:MAG: ABC transporter substrate-binding protein [Chloroflexi bacterium]|nr:ABC transporter substrate-binding protein [Chloroflexota bacterium]